MVLGVVRPLLIMWAGLNAIDDMSLLFRFSRLIMAVTPIPGLRQSQHTLCDVCDDVMGDLLKGTDGLEALPCAWACLRIPACMRMCERVKGASTNSTHFPCVAAGYCDAVAEGEVDADVECSVAPILRCVPEQLCKRTRNGLRFSCVLKPGIGRWIGMRNAVGTHASALASALYNQPRCGEEGAGVFCVAEPRGLAYIAELAGHALTLGYGTLKTVWGRRVYPPRAPAVRDRRA